MKTPEMMCEWITTLSPEEKQAIVDCIEKSTVNILEKLQSVQHTGKTCRRLDAHPRLRPYSDLLTHEDPVKK